MRRARMVAAVLGALLTTGLLPSVGHGETGCTRPFPHRNQIPPVLISLELTGLSPCVLERGVIEAGVFSQFSNTYRNKAGGDSYLIIDHQRLDNRVTARVGLGGDSDLALTVSHVRDSGGHSDRWINRLHERFNRPDGGRSLTGDNLYQYAQYNGETGRLILLETPPAGMGDLVLTWRRAEGPLDWPEDWRWGWRLAAKAPTGEGSPAISSGEWDAGGGLLLDGRIATPLVPLGGVLNLGAVYHSPTGALVFPTRRWVLMATAGLAAYLGERFSLGVQWQLASPRFVDNPIEVLRKPQNLMALGGQYRGEGWWMQLGLTEDPNTTGEDVSLFLALGMGG